MYPDITCAILAGGKSLRMGRNKALMKLGSETVIEKIVGIAKASFNKINFITNTFEEYEFLGLKMYEDVFRNSGPLSGIHSGLKNAGTDSTFVLSCDMPFISTEMINYILDYPSTKPVKICKAAGYIQPLAGVYSKSIIELIENYLTKPETGNHDDGGTKKKCGIHEFLNQIDIELLEPENQPFYSDKLFFNMNSPDDYNEIIMSFEGKQATQELK